MSVAVSQDEGDREDPFDAGRAEFFSSLENLRAQPPTELLAWLIAYFSVKAAGRTFKRKPSMRFRTTFEERQVDVMPGWQSRGSRSAREVVLIPGQLSFNLNAFSDRFKAWRWALMLRWDPSAGFTFRGVSGGYLQGLEEVERLRRFFAAATTDREATLRGGADGRCCFCGKVLTDSVSMSRGIGPECYRDFVGFASVQASLAIPQDGNGFSFCKADS
jgi:hypothetical protein